MLKGFDEKGSLRTIKMSEEGELYVKSSGTGKQQIINDESNPIPAFIIKENETTLYATVETVGTEQLTIEVGKKVSEIDIANYSETSNLTIIAGELNAVIGPNMALTLSINKQIDNIYLISNETNTKVQIVVKGVE